MFSIHFASLIFEYCFISYKFNEMFPLSLRLSRCCKINKQKYSIDDAFEIALSTVKPAKISTKSINVVYKTHYKQPNRVQKYISMMNRRGSTRDSVRRGSVFVGQTQNFCSYFWTIAYNFINYYLSSKPVDPVYIDFRNRIL